MVATGVGGAQPPALANTIIRMAFPSMVMTCGSIGKMAPKKAAGLDNIAIQIVAIGMASRRMVVIISKYYCYLERS